MENISKDNIKFRGSYFVFIGTGISLISKFIAIFLFMQIDPSFNIIKNYISDLGDGPNYSNIVFNIGIVLSGVFNGIFFLYFMKFLRKKGGDLILSYLSLIGGLTAAMGAILVGLFTSETASELHNLGAAFAFFGNFFAIIFVSTTELKIPQFSKRIAIFGYFLAPLGFLFLLFYLLLHTIPGFSREITIFTEWMAFYGNTIWLIIQAIYSFNIQVEK